MQIHQLLAAQDLQHGLHLGLGDLKLAPRAGHPHKTLGRHAASRERGQVLGFSDAVCLDVKNAHGAFWQNGLSEMGS